MTADNYQNVLIDKVLQKGLFAVCQFIDSKIVDGTANGIALSTMATGRVIRRTGTGQLQFYGLTIGAGILVIFLFVYFFG